MKIKRAANKLRKTLLAEFEITDIAGLEILERAIESFCRMREAQEIVSKEGLTIINRFGEKKEHPSLNTERKALAQFLLAIKQLNLDVLPPNHKIGRPGGR
jgi:phage terminase small subunit